MSNITNIQCQISNVRQTHLSFDICRLWRASTLSGHLTFVIPHLGGAGQSLIELIIAIAIAAIIMPALFYGMITSTRAKAQETQSLGANAMLKEGIEAVRAAREANWTNVATNGNYHPLIIGNQWTLAANSENINQFTRIATIADTFRDTSGNIISSGGVIDPSTKKVTIIVSWTTPYSSSISSTLYLTRWVNNVAIAQPATINFSTYSSVTSTNVTANTNTVTLAPVGPGRGNWCTNAATAVNTLNLTGNSLAQDLWGIPGTAFAGTGATLPLANIAITNPSAPANPVASTAWTFTPANSGDVFGDSTYSYLATSSDTEEIIVVSNSTHAKVTSFNLTGNTNATSVFVLNNIGYAITGSNLFTFNMSAPVSGTSRSPSTTVALGGAGQTVKVVQLPQGTFAFVSLNIASPQLKVFKVNSLTSLTLVGQAVALGGAGRDVAISADGTRAYLVTAVGASQREFFVLDSGPALTAVSPVNLTTLASYDTNGMTPLAVGLVLNDLRAVIVGSGSGVHQLQVVDLRASPIAECGYINDLANSNSIYDFAQVVEADNDAWGYILTANNGAEFQILNGGPGGQYATTGTYESATFDAGANVAFNRLTATFDQPAGTQARFQIAAKSAAGSCSGVTFSSTDFVGPSNDPAQYFTLAGTGVLNLNIPVQTITGASFQNPGRCLRYRVLFTPSTSYLLTPALQNIEVNYSP